MYISACLWSVDCVVSHCTSYCLVMTIYQRIGVPKCEIIAKSISDQLLASSIAVKSLNFGCVLRSYVRPLIFHERSARETGNESSCDERLVLQPLLSDRCYIIELHKIEIFMKHTILITQIGTTTAKIKNLSFVSFYVLKWYFF